MHSSLWGQTRQTETLTIGWWYRSDVVELDVLAPPWDVPALRFRRACAPRRQFLAPPPYSRPQTIPLRALVGVNQNNFGGSGPRALGGLCKENPPIRLVWRAAANINLVIRASSKLALTLAHESKCDHLSYDSMGNFESGCPKSRNLSTCILC